MPRPKTWRPANRRALVLPAIAAATALCLAALSPASASNRAMMHSGMQPVNVSVSYNSQFPIADLSEDAVSKAQREGRVMLYRLARSECKLLLSTIAKSCRLTHLNVSTQIQDPGHSNPPRLYINSSATFQITLKGDAGAWDDEDDSDDDAEE